MTNVRRALAGWLAAAAVVATLAAPPASAAWQVTATAPAFSLSAEALGAPVTSCTTVPGALGLVDSARVSWTAVPGAKSYRLSFGASGQATQTTTATSFDVTGTLLLSLLGNVLFGSSTTVTVAAVADGWTSPASNAQTIVLANVVSGLLGGVRCQRS